MYTYLEYRCRLDGGVQTKVLECKAKQVQQDINSNNLNVEAWLLARKSLAGGEWPLARLSPAV